MGLIEWQNFFDLAFVNFVVYPIYPVWLNILDITHILASNFMDSIFFFAY